MPIYPFFCPKHGDFEVFGDYDHASDGKCPMCGAKARRTFKGQGVKVIVDFRPGWQPAFGKYVDTKRERDNLAAERGLIREP